MRKQKKLSNSDQLDFFVKLYYKTKLRILCEIECINVHLRVHFCNFHTAHWFEVRKIARFFLIKKIFRQIVGFTKFLPKMRETKGTTTATLWRLRNVCITVF